MLIKYQVLIVLARIFLFFGEIHVFLQAQENFIVRVKQF